MIHLLILALLPLVTPQCSITQTCTNPKDSSTCTIPHPDSSPPAVQPDMAKACPNFKDQKVCCNSDQVTELYNNFQLIDYVFGSAGGGCDICANNVKRFWCYYTCSPKQKQFVFPGDLIDVVQDGVSYHVRNVSFYIEPQLAVDIYSSCSKVQKITLNTPMQSPAGLLQFLGSNSVQTGKCLINVIYEPPQDKSIVPLSMEKEMCSETFKSKDRYGFPVHQNCSCNNCASMCKNDFDFSVKQSALHGFNGWLVLGVYLGIGLATLGINFIRAYLKKERVKSRSISLNSSQLLKEDDLIRIIKNPRAAQ